MMLQPMLRRRGVLAAALTLFATYRGVSATEFANVVEGSALRAKSNREARGRLYESLLSKAKPVVSGPLQVNSGQEEEVPEFMKVGTRRLGNDDDVDYGNFGFDVTDYSIKYVGCSAVQTYSDELAQDEDSPSVLQLRNYVIFRLCLTQYCSADETYGCSSNYGEYVMLMDDYLQAMAQYNEERKEAYCDFCEECMDAENGNDNGRRKRRGRRLDGAAEGEAAEEEAAEEEGAGGQHACEYYNACYNYLDKCEDGDDNAVEYDQYFECQEVDGNDDGNEGISTGPHCGSDGVTITIGLYKDQYCSQYIGDTYDVADYTGIAFADDGLAEYYPSGCISCRESELPYEVVDEDAEDDNEVNELCEELYDAAAKCNKYFYDAEDESYMSYQQDDNEGKVCTFISDLVSGTYDEGGEIILDNSDWIHANWENIKKYYHQVEEEVTTWQIIALVSSVLACFVMACYACYLHRAITRKAPWRPRRGGAGEAAGKISRQNSGIVMGRSRSGGSYHGGTMT